MRRFTPLLIFSLVLMGCSVFSGLPPSAPAAEPTAVLVEPTQAESAAGATAGAVQTAEVVSTAADPTATEPPPTTPTTAVPPTDTPQPADEPTLSTSVPHTLYLLKQDDQVQSLFTIPARTGEIQRVSAENEDIRCFDVSQEDGRIVMGTGDGKIYAQARGGGRQLLIDVSPGSPYPAQVNGCAWSPDGSRLAYTVGYLNPEDVPFPSAPSGVWVANADGSDPLWLASNFYSNQPEMIINTRRYEDPAWSPDGQALLLTLWYYEGSDKVWFDPIAPVADDEALRRDPGGIGWGAGEWTADGQGLLLSGLSYSSVSSLTWVRRDGQQTEVWVDGMEEELYVSSVFAFKTGVAFIAAPLDPSGEWNPGFYYGKKKGDAFRWGEKEHSPMCGPAMPYATAEGPGQNQVTVLCGNGEMRIATVPAMTINRIDLSAALPTITFPIKLVWAK